MEPSVQGQAVTCEHEITVPCRFGRGRLKVPCGLPAALYIVQKYKSYIHGTQCLCDKHRQVLEKQGFILSKA